MNFISFMELNGFRMGMKRGEFRVWIPGKNVISKWKSFKNNLIMIDISTWGRGSCGHLREDPPGKNTGSCDLFQRPDRAGKLSEKEKRGYHKMGCGDGLCHGRSPSPAHLRSGKKRSSDFRRCAPMEIMKTVFLPAR